MDEAVAARLLAGTGARAARVLPGRDRRQGKSWLDRNGPNLVAAGEHVPVLVLRDLDRDGCVVEVRNRIAARLSRFACVRIAVRAVEAWLLADRDELAAQIGVRTAAVPAAPDELADPKRALVDLARRSTRRATRDMLVPREGAGTSSGRNMRSSSGPSYRNPGLPTGRRSARRRFSAPAGPSPTSSPTTALSWKSARLGGWIVGCVRMGNAPRRRSRSRPEPASRRGADALALTGRPLRTSPPAPPRRSRARRCRNASGSSPAPAPRRSARRRRGRASPPRA